MNGMKISKKDRKERRGSKWRKEGGRGKNE